MGRIVFDTASSLNGHIADEHHLLDGLFAVAGEPRRSEEVSEALCSANAVVMAEGSTTYE